MSGLLALLDDVAAIAKVAAASIDDIAGGAAKAGAKAAGVVIDDAAVTPRYVHGFEAGRELPIIWRIAQGSLRNKLVILLPLALALSAFAPGVITPLLMLGGAYLCFEGAEKIARRLGAGDDHAASGGASGGVRGDGPTQLEEAKVAGAIKTDFILSAEIMTLALATIPEGAFWVEAVTLALVGIGITALVYGGVAVIVKLDDIGLHLARVARLAPTRAVGRGLVRAMPIIMVVLSNVGTAAMLWVGGSIIVHGAEGLGYGWLAHHIEAWAAAVGHFGPGQALGAVDWLVTAALNGVFGLGLGLMLIPLVNRIVVPLWVALTGRRGGAAH